MARSPGHRIISKGYALVWYPDHPLAQSNGYVRENRYVAWETFGPFDPSCHVHHLDEDKLNNDPANLEVLTPSAHASGHGDGSRFDEWRRRPRQRQTRYQPRGRGRGERREPSDEQAQRDVEIVRLNSLGWKNRRIAGEVGCSDGAVSRALMRHGRMPSTSG